MVKYPEYRVAQEQHDIFITKVSGSGTICPWVFLFLKPTLGHLIFIKNF